MWLPKVGWMLLKVSSPTLGYGLAAAAPRVVVSGAVVAVIGIFAVSPRAGDRSGMSAINRGFFISAVISAVLVSVMTYLYLPDRITKIDGIIGVSVLRRMSSTIDYPQARLELSCRCGDMSTACHAYRAVTYYTADSCVDRDELVIPDNLGSTACQR